jgi:peptide/nickel transport system substrate-binding protein
MIQGGDPNTKDDDPSNDGMGGPGYTIDAEFSDISHERGILSMARASDPDSAGSQFFIMQDDAPQLDGKYSVFGRVSEGLGVVDEIAYVERDSRDRPLEDVEMQVRVFIKSDDRTSVDTNNQTHTEDNQNIDTNSTLVSMPRDIPGTIRNNRPIKFKKGKPGGVFVSYGLEGPSTWNDSQCKDYISSSLIYRLQPGLMNINYDTGQWNVFLGDQSKGDEGPGYDIVVDDYQNKMEIIIYLRKDIYWSDDTHMTSDDWVYYWNEIMSNPDIGHNAYNSTIVKDNGKELPIVAKKIDRFTFKYVFPRQIGDPELSISGGVMPKHIIKPVMDAEGEAGLRDMWGVNTPLKDLLVYGPWIPHQFNLGVNIVFVKNEKYFKKDEWNNQLPYLDKYVVDIIPDNDGGLLKFMNRELSEINIPSNEFTNMVDRADDDGYSVWNGGPNTGVLFLTFNLNPNSSRMKGTPQLRWFSDKRFRQALNYLINKEDLINRVLNGLGEPDKGNLHSSSPYFNPDITFPNEYNPREALRIMREELDIRDRDGDGILEDDTGTNITFELLTNTSNEERIQVMHIISSNWNDYGIDVNTKNIDFDSLVQKLISNFDWETMLMGLTGGIWPSSGANVWRSSANLHFWHPYQDEPATEWEAEVDMLFEKARNEPDFHLRKEHWDDMYKILYDQVPYLLIYRKYSFKAIYDEWENVKWDTMSSVGGYYNQYLFKK